MTKEKKGLNNKEILIGILPNIGITIIMIVVFYLIRVNIFIFMSIFAGLAAAKEIYKTIKEPADRSLKRSIKRIIKAVVFSGALYLYIHLFGRFGIYGYFIVCFSLAGMQLWRGREMFMQGIRDIETKIFGKPLDKENWRKDK